MPNFNIIKKSEIIKTFRVSKIMSDFDVKIEHSNEHFEGEIKIPNKWNIGVIVGPSGTGKTTIAKELFNKELINEFNYKNKSVIDDMPKEATPKEIWKICKEYSGIKKKEFFEYYKNKQKAYAYEIIEIKEVNMELSEITKRKFPPQSFYYIENN